MKRKALGRDFGLTVRMTIALALLVLLNLAIATALLMRARRPIRA